MIRHLQTIRRSIPGMIIWFIAAGHLPAADLAVEVATRFNGRALTLNQPGYTNAAGQAISVSRLDWLLSEFRLRSTDGRWAELTDQTAFLSVGQSRTNFGLSGLPDGRFDRLSFRVGLNPKLNASNPARRGPDHPLNPVLNGLHWSWQGGYVFLALEGRWEDRDAKRRSPDSESGGFSHHLGNDHMRMIVERPVKLSWPADRSLQITLDLDSVFGGDPPLIIDAESASTHGRKGDQLAVRLQTGVVDAFGVEAATSQSAPVEASAKSPNPRRVVLINPEATPYRFTFGRHFPPPRLPMDNPLTEEGVALGKRLFLDPILSVNGQQSCSTCHQPNGGFVDAGRAVSLGTEGNPGTRNSMPLFNLAWKDRFFWDGRAPTLRAQVLMPIQNPLEMHETLPNVVGKLRRTGYPKMFEQAFGTPTIDPDRVARALEQFLLTLVSYDSKFDRAMRRSGQLTEQEKEGFYLFMTEYEPRRGLYGADCFHCHGGPLFSSNGFANNGLNQNYGDPGVAKLTGKDYDQGRFSVPSLRNVELTGPYMHDGRFQTLAEVVAHYSSGVKRSAALDPNLAKHPPGGIGLPESKQMALVAFLKTLTDERFRRPAGMGEKDPR
jgi:cytochrome c peroxidase